MRLVELAELKELKELLLMSFFFFFLLQCEHGNSLLEEVETRRQEYESDLTSLSD